MGQATSPLQCLLSVLSAPESSPSDVCIGFICLFYGGTAQAGLTLIQTHPEPPTSAHQVLGLCYHFWSIIDSFSCQSKHSHLLGPSERWGQFSGTPKRLVVVN